MFGFLGKLFVGFLAVIAALGGIGLWQAKRGTDKTGSGPAGQEKTEELLNEKTVDNVLALNDRFNRARYQDKDGE